MLWWYAQKRRYVTYRIQPLQTFTLWRLLERAVAPRSRYLIIHKLNPHTHKIHLYGYSVRFIFWKYVIVYVRLLHLNRTINNLSYYLDKYNFSISGIFDDIYCDVLEDRIRRYFQDQVQSESCILNLEAFRSIAYERTKEPQLVYGEKISLLWRALLKADE